MLGRSLGRWCWRSALHSGAVGYGGGCSDSLVVMRASTSYRADDEVTLDAGCWRRVGADPRRDVSLILLERSMFAPLIALTTYSLWWEAI
jgi:hypothetical protein